jgi:hypothetical protein
LQGFEEWTVQISRGVIDRAKNGGRQEEVGGELAAMVRDVEVSANYAQARHGVFRPVRAGARDMSFVADDVVKCVYLNTPHARAPWGFATSIARTRHGVWIEGVENDSRKFGT